MCPKLIWENTETVKSLDTLPLMRKCVQTFVQYRSVKIILCRDKKLNLTLYKCPRSVQCASAGEGKWHHGPARHAGSSWVTWSVDRSGRSDEQDAHRERRRDECTAHLTTDSRSLWGRAYTHTDTHKFKSFTFERKRVEDTHSNYSLLWTAVCFTQ